MAYSNLQPKRGVKLLAFAFQLSEMLSDKNVLRSHSVRPSARMAMENRVDASVQKETPENRIRLREIAFGSEILPLIADQCHIWTGKQNRRA
jgi:hypothetical protein